MRYIRTLRAMRRELETELRRLLHGHAGGNPGHGQGAASGSPRQFPTLPGEREALGERTRDALHLKRSKGGARRYCAVQLSRRSGWACTSTPWRFEYVARVLQGEGPSCELADGAEQTDSIPRQDR